MKDVNIDGVNLRFDIGTLRHLASMTGKDALNPLEGLDTYTQAAHILLSANIRAHKINPGLGAPHVQNMAESDELINNSSPQFVIDIVRAFTKAMQIKAELSNGNPPNETPAQTAEPEKKMDLQTT